MSTPNRVFFKPPFEGVTGHPQNTLTSGSESLKEVLCKYLYYINYQLYVIVSDFFYFKKYLTIPDSVAKQKRNQHIIILCYYKIALIFFNWLISIEGFIF